MKSRILMFSLAVGVTLLPITTLTQVPTLAQQPAPPNDQPTPQQTPVPSSPAQPTPPSRDPAPQQAPGQPLPPTQPTSPPQQPAPQQAPGQPLPPTQTPPSQEPAPQQAPAQPTPEPAPAEPQTTGPTSTIEGAVTNVVSLTCGTTATTNPISMPGGTGTGSTSAVGSQSTDQGCSAVLQITPGVNWAQVAKSELFDQRETAGGLPGFGLPVSVAVGPNASMTTRHGAAISLLDLVKGSIVKVDYSVRNDVPVATNIDVTWHAGQ